MGQRFNERAREHRLAVRNESGGHLELHCMCCGCEPPLELTKFIKTARKKTEREIVETFLIRASGDKCISTPFIARSDGEVSFLDSFV